MPRPSGTHGAGVPGGFSVSCHDEFSSIGADTAQKVGKRVLLAGP